MRGPNGIGSKSAWDFVLVPSHTMQYCVLYAEACFIQRHVQGQNAWPSILRWFLVCFVFNPRQHWRQHCKALLRHLLILLIDSGLHSASIRMLFIERSTVHFQAQAAPAAIAS